MILQTELTLFWHFQFVELLFRNLIYDIKRSAFHWQADCQSEREMWEYIILSLLWVFETYRAFKYCFDASWCFSVGRIYISTICMTSHMFGHCCMGLDFYTFLKICITSKYIVPTPCEYRHIYEFIISFEFLHIYTFSLFEIEFEFYCNLMM